MNTEEKSDKTKGFKVTQEFLNEINQTIKASGMNDIAWLKSVMALQALHDIKKVDPSIESDLDDLVKCFNRAYHIVIRQHQRAADQLDEVREKNQGDTIKLEEEVRLLKEELAEQKKMNKKQSDELAEAQLKNQELTERIRHFDQVSSSYNENIRLKNEKIQDLEARNKLLTASENELSMLKEEMNVIVSKHSSDMAASKEVERTLRVDVEKLSQEISKLSEEHQKELKRRNEDHKKELEMQKKELNMEMRDALLTEKDLTNKAIEELNQKHNADMKELLQSFSKEKKEGDD